MAKIDGHSHKTSIVRGTKEGALYLDVRELFEQDDVKELVVKLYNSSIRKKIISRKLEINKG